MTIIFDGTAGDPAKREVYVQQLESRGISLWVSHRIISASYGALDDDLKERARQQLEDIIATRRNHRRIRYAQTHGLRVIEINDIERLEHDDDEVMFLMLQG